MSATASTAAATTNGRRTPRASSPRPNVREVSGGSATKSPCRRRGMIGASGSGEIRTTTGIAGAGTAVGVADIDDDAAVICCNCVMILRVEASGTASNSIASRCANADAIDSAPARSPIVASRRRPERSATSSSGIIASACRTSHPVCPKSPTLRESSASRHAARCAMAAKRERAASTHCSKSVPTPLTWNPSRNGARYRATASDHADAFTKASSSVASQRSEPGATASDCAPVEMRTPVPSDWRR